MVILKDQSFQDQQPMDCSEINDELNTLRQEFSALVLDIKEYATAILKHNEEVATVLFAIAEGETR